ncbi:MAG: SIS domain-containing protein [bacterium]
MLERFPDDLTAGFESARRQVAGIHRRPGAAFWFFGMGGSAVGAMLLPNLFDHPPTIQVRSALGLKSRPPDHLLGVFVSYSGQTEETLSAYSQAGRLKLRRAAVTSGGPLQAAADHDKVPCVMVPGGRPPRMALPFLLTANLAIAQEVTGKPLSKDLKAAATALNRAKPRVKKGAIETAERIIIHDGIPMVWGVTGVTKAAAYRWRTQINENAKMLAFEHEFPELSHNEIVAACATEVPLAIVTLETPHDEPLVVRQRAHALNIITETNPNVLHIRARARSATRFGCVLELVWLGDWVSYYLAKLRGMDPVGIPPIIELKRRMGQ